MGTKIPSNYEPEIEKLADIAPQRTVELYKQNKDLLDFVVQRHMDFATGNFSKETIRNYFVDGKVKNHPWMKMLLILMWADKMGTMPEKIVQSLAANTKKLTASSEWGRERERRMAKQGAFQGTPQQMAQMLGSRNMNRDQRVRALKGKYPQLSDMEINQLLPEGFKSYFEMSNQPVTMPLDIQIPEDCVRIAQALKAPDPQNTEIYGVGGCVRDAINGQSPKDFDLVTNIDANEITQRLHDAGITANVKNNQNTFNVVFANAGGDEPVEVAGFRSDGVSSDGRRPDQIDTDVGIEEDAMRRDLTMNNLYYDFGYGKYGKNVAVDFNPQGQGIQDAQNGVARPVGNAFERFAEDRLRILRLIRFFSRFNDGDINEFTDEATLQAIHQLGDLRAPTSIEGTELIPITSERIQEEFLKGLRTAKDAKSYFDELPSTWNVEKRCVSKYELKH